MQHQYYIDNNGAKDGPHDLVTLMRRIRARKIDMNTLIFVGDASTSVPAREVEDLGIFFKKSAEFHPSSSTIMPGFTAQSVLRDGIRFLIEHNVMTVFAGSLTLICLLGAIVMIGFFGPYLGGMLSWVLFVILNNLFAAFCLRIYRGQPISIDYLNNTLAPVFPTLLIASLCIALMTVGGFILLIFPAIVVAIYYLFVPFFIVDRQMSVVEAMLASRLLVQKFGKRYFYILLVVALSYIGSLILIFPAPLTMPIFTAALIKIYEELSAG